MIRSTLFLLFFSVLPHPARTQDLLVTSRFTDQILRYDAQGQFVGVFAGGGRLSNPVGLTYGPDGHVYVASADTSEVLRYDGGSGAFLGVFAAGGGLNGPRNLNFGPDGDLYVCSGASDQVLRYDGRTGVFRGVVAQHTRLDGSTSLTFGPDGMLYVVSVLQNRILRFDPRSGTFLRTFSRIGLATPHDLTFGPDGHLYVTNVADPTRAVVRMDGKTGAFLDTFVNDPSLSAPLGLAFGADGHLWVCNQNRDDVRRYDGVSGAPLGSFVSQGSGGLDGPLFAVWTGPRNAPQVEPPAPAGAGHDVGFLMRGLRPGGAAALLVGTTPAQIPLGCLGNAELRLLDPLVLVLATADESGHLLRRFFVPAELGGTAWLFQAIDGTGCASSPLLSHRF